MTKTLFYTIAIPAIFLLTNCTKDRNAESYLYQGWKTTEITKDGVNITYDCDLKSWIKLYSTNYYDAHEGCANASISNIPFIYNKENNSITLTTLSNKPLLIVQLDKQTLILEQNIEGIIQRHTFTKM